MANIKVNIDGGSVTTKGDFFIGNNGGTRGDNIEYTQKNLNVVAEKSFSIANISESKRTRQETDWKQKLLKHSESFVGRIVARILTNLLQ